MSDITAKDIIKLLAIKHSADVFVPECKTGPTYGGSPQRFDAWAMPKSYSQFRAIGYEVKVSRSDFLGDDKWQGYLPYCHEFNFVAPPGIIDVSELPEGIGLYVVAKTGTRLFRKRKAVRRDIELDPAILIYIMFSRAVVHDEYGVAPGQSDYWANWLEDKNQNQVLGHHVSRRLQELYRENVNDVKAENMRLKNIIKGLEYLKPIVDGLGIDPENNWLETALRQRVTEAKGLDLSRDARRLIDQLQRFSNKIDSAVSELSNKQQRLL